MMKRLFLSSLVGAILLASTGVDAYDLSGTLLHAGVPMSKVTKVEPSFWFGNEDTGQTYDDAIATYSSSTGAYSIENLSGNIGISIAFHVTGEYETLPGNYRLWRVVGPSTPSNIDLEIPVIMHILEPYDNAIIRDLIPPYPVHPSPLSFRWEEVKGATYYQILIYKCEADTCTSFQHTNIKDAIYRTRLPNSAPDQSYWFSITAFMESSLIGYNMTTFKGGGYGDYEFQVQTPFASIIAAISVLLLHD
jgi:hypothetical protein